MERSEDEGRGEPGRRRTARRDSSEEVGPERKLMMDANQVWDVEEAIERMERLKEFDPWWIE